MYLIVYIHTLECRRVHDDRNKLAAENGQQEFLNVGAALAHFGSASLSGCDH
jgi:hypothetical protein